MFLPSKSQWNSWSLPSRLTAIGAYIGLIGVILTIIFFLLPIFKNITMSHQNIEKTLSEARAEENWEKLNQTLSEIKSEKELEDLYFFYKSIDLLYSKGSLKTPKMYLQKFPIDSKLYISAKKLLAFYYRKKYKNDKTTARLKLKEIANNIKNDGVNTPFYEYLILTSMSEFNINDINKLIRSIQKKYYGEIIDFNNYSTVINIKQNERAYLDRERLSDIVATLFLANGIKAELGYYFSLNKVKTNSNKQLVLMLKEYPYIRSFFKNLYQANLYDKIIKFKETSGQTSGLLRN